MCINVSDFELFVLKIIYYLFAIVDLIQNNYGPNKKNKLPDNVFHLYLKRTISAAAATRKTPIKRSNAL